MIIELKETTTTEEIEDWDSFEHINLVLAVEEELWWGVLLVINILFYCLAATPYTLVYLGISTILA